jgi:hypothetical protein
MERTKCRVLAVGLLTATLGLGIAACGDDTTSMDMAMPPDMHAPNPDMTGAPPGIGQVIVADLVGTAYSQAAPPPNGAPRTHVLLALTSFPKVVPTSDPTSDLNFTAMTGCTVNRYTATNLPPADGDAGNVTISGYNVYTLATNVTTGITLQTPAPPITCIRLTTPPNYACFFGGAVSPDSGPVGALVSNIAYPLIPQASWPFPGCITRVTPAGTFCEQSPILGLGVAQITESISGGADFPAASDTVGNGGGLDGGLAQFPGPVYVVAATSGGTNITGMDLLTGGRSLPVTDASISAANDLTITFSCDPNNATTQGAGCAGSSDTAALLVRSSTSKKPMFGVTTATGLAECVAHVTTGTIKITGVQLTALLGGQTGGSIQLALARLALHPKPAGTHLVAFAGGMGAFSFVDQ